MSANICEIIAHGPGREPGAVGLMATWARVKGQVCHTVLSWKKVCQNCLPVTFMLTAHAQQCGIVGVFTDKVSANDFFVCFQNDQTDNNSPR